MIKYLPQVPLQSFGDREGRYMVELVRRIEQELAMRPRKQKDGSLYVSRDAPLRMISPNGTVYDVSVTDAGALEINESTL